MLTKFSLLYGLFIIGVNNFTVLFNEIVVFNENGALKKFKLSSIRKKMAENCSKVWFMTIFMYSVSDYWQLLYAYMFTFIQIWKWNVAFLGFNLEVKKM